MIYVVSGIMRTGTSMMMRALWEGGLDLVSNPIREKMNQVWGDEHYQPNASGFWEFTMKEYREFGFPLKYKGKLIKVLRGGLPHLEVHKYKIVFMIRHPTEIKASYDAFFETLHQRYEALNQKPPGRQQLDRVLANYYPMMRSSIRLLKNRKDTEVTVLCYPEVIQYPKRAFVKLKDRGWPIDVEAAAAVPTRDLYRFRLGETC